MFMGSCIFFVDLRGAPASPAAARPAPPGLRPKLRVLFFFLFIDVFIRPQTISSITQVQSLNSRHVVIKHCVTSVSFSPSLSRARP
jgi:hypothetical protein